MPLTRYPFFLIIMNSSITGFDICYMRDTHYIIFCHPKKQLIIVFRVGNTMETAYLRLHNGCRAFHELANVYKEYQLNFDIFEGYSTS